MNLATHGYLLVIDALQDSSKVVSQHLIGLGYTVTCVESGQKALDLMRQNKFEMVLIDLPMQDRSAEEFIKGMKADNALRGIPLMILADRDQLEEAERCMKSGAEDYIVLPFIPVVLKARVSANLERQRVRNAEQLQKETMKYGRDVEIGQQIQLSFLPEKLPQPPGWEIVAHFEPDPEVAGDFYDAFSLSNNHVSLIMGDVSDKGITAALFMALFRSLLRAYIQQDYSAGRLDGLDERSNVGSSVERVIAVQSIDRQLLKTAIELTNSYILNNHASSNMFATIFFGILDPISGVLIYINAGHEPPLVFQQGGKVTERLNPTGLAVGMMPDVDFKVQQIQLEPGDTLLIFSDGVLEAKNPSGQSFGKEGLLKLLEKADSTATALINRIESSLRAHIAESAQLDDLTTLAVRRLA